MIVSLAAYAVSFLLLPMSPVKFILSVVAAAVLGFVAGWWLFGVTYAQPTNPVTEQAADRTAVTSGYCCFAPGETCAEVSVPAECFVKGGKGFHTRLEVCQNFCTKIGSIKQK